MVGGLEPPPEDEEARAEAAKQQSVIFVLEGASLETAKVGKVRSALALLWITCKKCRSYLQELHSLCN